MAPTRGPHEKSRAPSSWTGHVAWFIQVGTLVSPIVRLPKAQQRQVAPFLLRAHLFDVAPLGDTQ